MKENKKPIYEEIYYLMITSSDFRGLFCGLFCVSIISSIVFLTTLIVFHICRDRCKVYMQTIPSQRRLYIFTTEYHIFQIVLLHVDLLKKNNINKDDKVI